MHHSTISPEAYKAVEKFIEERSDKKGKRMRGINDVYETMIKITMALCKKYNVTLEDLQKMINLDGIGDLQPHDRFSISVMSNGKHTTAVPISMDFVVLNGIEPTHKVISVKINLIRRMLEIKSTAENDLPVELLIGEIARSFSRILGVRFSVNGSINIPAEQIMNALEKVADRKFAELRNIHQNMLLEEAEPKTNQYNGQEKIQGIILLLEKYIAGGKARRIDKIIYAMLKHGREIFQTELAGLTKIGLTDLSYLLIEMENDGWVQRIRKRKVNIVRLNIAKILDEGLPPRQKTLKHKIVELLKQEGSVLQRDIPFMIKTTNSCTDELSEMEKAGVVSRKIVSTGKSNKAYLVSLADENLLDPMASSMKKISKEIKVTEKKPTMTDETIKPIVKKLSEDQIMPILLFKDGSSFEPIKKV